MPKPSKASKVIKKALSYKERYPHHTYELYAQRQTQKRKGTPNRNKRVTCEECGKEMRADNLHRHQ